MLTTGFVAFLIQKPIMYAWLGELLNHRLSADIQHSRVLHDVSCAGAHLLRSGMFCSHGRSGRGMLIIQEGLDTFEGDARVDALL